MRAVLHRLLSARDLRRYVGHMAAAARFGERRYLFKIRGVPLKSRLSRIEVIFVQLIVTKEPEVFFTVLRHAGHRRPGNQAPLVRLQVEPRQS